jgi:carbon-monoxide dehydrogenase medium subunit
MTVSEYVEPRSLSEAHALVDRFAADGKVMAGGTALVLLMRQKLLQPTALINVRRVPELRGIAQEHDDIVVGALTTHEQAARSALLVSQYPALARTFASVATPRIRNAGTVGGNLAHGDPHLDPPVSLLALDARVVLRSSSGERSMPVSQFFRGYYETEMRPDEILCEIRFPARRPNERLAFMKVLPRSVDDYATVDLAAWVRVAGGVIEDVRLAIGSAGPVVFRARGAEDLLRGHELDAALLRQAGESAASAADPDDDVRGSAEYKRELIKVMLGRVVSEAAGTQAETAS